MIHEIAFFLNTIEEVAADYYSLLEWIFMPKIWKQYLAM